MTDVSLTPLRKSVQKKLTVPGCLSYTVRAMVIASLSGGRVCISNPSRNEDTRIMIEILKSCGLQVMSDNQNIIIEGNIIHAEDKEYMMHIGLSGRSARMALAMAAIMPGIKTITCDDGFKKRPVGDLVFALQNLGADIHYLEKEGHFPVLVRSSRLTGHTVRLKGSVSSQFLSALLLIAPLLGGLSIEITDRLVSRSYADMTVEIMNHFGVTVENREYRQFCVPRNSPYLGKDYTVEPDATSAGYFWALAAITAGSIRVSDVSPDSTQGDIFLPEIFEKMGCLVRIDRKNKWIEVEGTGKLEAVTADLSVCPDSVQTLAVVAAFARGKTVITGVGNLRYKETDRIKATVSELRKMGIDAMETGDGVIVEGGVPHGAVISTYGDHRMAMAFAIAGAKVSGMVIKDSEVVNKSFPGFWSHLEELGVGENKINV